MSLFLEDSERNNQGGRKLFEYKLCNQRYGIWQEDWECDYCKLFILTDHWYQLNRN